MIIDDNLLKSGEKISLTLKGLYSEYGYKPYYMSKFEEYDLYSQNKEFLVSDNVITFTDTNGKLMALKPDVTLSIIKNSGDGVGVNKVFYSENVYRVSKGTGAFKEIMQTGLECFGDVKAKDETEVIVLAVKSLKSVSKSVALCISDLSILKKAVAELGLGKDAENEIYKAIGDKNTKQIYAICDKNGVKTKKQKLLFNLLSSEGKLVDVAGKLEKIFSKTADKDAAAFISLLLRLVKSDVAEYISVDFSITGDVNYYGGAVFKGYVKGVPHAVLSGGRYDNLMKKLGKNAKAIGFAVYTDLLERTDSDKEDKEGDGYINVALPKGRLGEKVYSMFEKAGFECPSLLNPGRKLIFENAEKKVRYFWVKPSDVAIYVERGAADVGVAGKDILLEYSPEVYELIDLNTGKCKMAVAGPVGKNTTEAPLKVATKFSNIAKKYYAGKGVDIDIIKLNGSIEIAPILGLSDVIVDIVETGKTLKENKLEVKEEIVDISARLIANKSSFRFKGDAIKEMAASVLKISESEQ